MAVSASPSLAIIRKNSRSYSDIFADSFIRIFALLEECRNVKEDHAYDDKDAENRPHDADFPVMFFVEQHTKKAYSF